MVKKNINFKVKHNKLDFISQVETNFKGNRFISYLKPISIKYVNICFFSSTVKRVIMENQDLDDLIIECDILKMSGRDMRKYLDYLTGVTISPDAFNDLTKNKKSNLHTTTYLLMFVTDCKKQVLILEKFMVRKKEENMKKELAKHLKKAAEQFADLKDISEWMPMDISNRRTHALDCFYQVHKKIDFSLIELDEYELFLLKQGNLSYTLAKKLYALHVGLSKIEFQRYFDIFNEGFFVYLEESRAGILPLLDLRSYYD